MVVLIVTAVKPALRGWLTRWLIEARAGVFVGHVSARVRDLLWTMVVEQAGSGSALLIHKAATEQGFAVRSYGEPDRMPVDCEGITLMRFRRTKRKPRSGPDSAAKDD